MKHGRDSVVVVWVVVLEEDDATVVLVARAATDCEMDVVAGVGGGCALELEVISGLACCELVEGAAVLRDAEDEVDPIADDGEVVTLPFAIMNAPTPAMAMTARMPAAFSGSPIALRDRCIAVASVPSDIACLPNGLGEGLSALS